MSGAEVRVRRTAVYQGAGAIDRDVRIAGRVACVPEPGFMSSKNAAGPRVLRRLQVDSARRRSTSSCESVPTTMRIMCGSSTVS